MSTKEKPVLSKLAKEVLKATIDKTLRDIEHAKLYIGWYKSLSESQTDKKIAGGYALKLQQFEDALKLNEKALAYFTPLLK